MKKTILIAAAVMVAVALNAENQLKADTVYKASFVADNVAIDGASVGTPAVTYAYTKQVFAGTDPTAPNMSADGLKINNKQASGAKGFNIVTASSAGFAAPFAAKLSEIKADSVVWTYNYRDNNNNNSYAILEGKNGYAVILAGTNSDLLQGSGYAVIRGSSAGDSKLHLVKYDGGIYNNKTTDIAATETLTKKAYFTVRVVFEPATNNWKLYVLETSGAYTSPEEAVYTTCFTATDNTYVGEEMKAFGFAGSYNGNVSSQMWVKNYSVIAYSTKDSPTALHNVRGIKPATKIIRNGQLYFVRDGKAVNVLGY